MTTTDHPRSSTRTDSYVAADKNAEPAVVEGVDPRMRDRWVEARRAEGRRRLRVIVAVVSLASIIGIAYLVAASPLFGVDTISVRGTNRATAAAVRSAAHIPRGDPLVFLDRGAIARRIERVPAVDRAHVSTEFPNTVAVRVTERQPVGWTRATGPMPVALVDGSGRVVSRSPAPPPDLPEVLEVNGGAPGTTVTRPELFGGLGQLPVAVRTLASNWSLRNGVAVMTVRGSPPAVRHIRFGSLHDLAAKGAAAVAVIADLDRRGQRVRWLDVTVPAAPSTR